jgi:hypothetical protein
MVKKRKTTDFKPSKPAGAPSVPKKLLADIRRLIEQSRLGVAQAVNSALVLLYWQVGHRIRTEVLGSGA